MQSEIVKYPQGFDGRAVEVVYVSPPCFKAYWAAMFGADEIQSEIGEGDTPEAAFEALRDLVE